MYRTVCTRYILYESTSKTNAGGGRELLHSRLRTKARDSLIRERGNLVLLILFPCLYSKDQGILLYVDKADGR